MTSPRTHDTIEKMEGRRPICRARYVSSCCRGPVDVYLGPATGTPDDWKVSIVRVCALCGERCAGIYP